MDNQTNIEKILPLVQRPTRYINHEWNAVRRDNGVRVCLCFPDLYEVGASNLGLEILYHLVNGMENASAERCFAPAADLDAGLKKNNLPLFSLETQTPLSKFDIIGFSLQYELCATTILAMLETAGLPLLASERSGTFPLVIAGGPVTANPEPFAEFFDAFVLGDGEEVLGEIIGVVERAKTRPTTKQELLLSLAALPGVYVPSLYRVDYQADGTIGAVSPVSGSVPATVTKRTVKLDDAFFPSQKIVPYLQTVHNRLNIEVARGCAGRCRFCQATRYYAPWRVRSLDNVLSLTDKGLANTGFEEVAFSSLSCTDYKNLEGLLAEVNRRFGDKRVSISLPSLRCDQFSLEVARHLGQTKRPTLTFAPEAGSERLRVAIGKDLSESHITETLVRAWEMGWKQVKLYFMVGLPTETDDDVDGINRLLRSVKSRARGLNFTVTVSPFIPKAQTPFQWAPMEKTPVVKGRLVRLQKTLPAAVKGHYVDGTALEGVFARGDRRLSKVILQAYKKGCRFDQWREHFRYADWQAAFVESGIDPEFYLYRERGEHEIFPWDHLLFDGEKQGLWREYRRAFDAVPVKVELAPSTRSMPPASVVPRAPGQAVQRLRIRCARLGIVRFLSHLEQIEMIRRAIRRADLPLAYTAGFSPQLKVAFGPAVSVGYESESEYFEMEFARRIDPAEVEARLAKALPDGFAVRSVKRVPVFFPSLDSLLNCAEYHIGASADQERIDRFLAANEIIIEKEKEDRIERIDVKPLIRELRSDGRQLVLQLRFGPKRNVKPEKILQKLLNLGDSEVKQVPILRKALYIEKRDGEISEP